MEPAFVGDAGNFHVLALRERKQPFGWDGYGHSPSAFGPFPCLFLYVEPHDFLFRRMGLSYNFTVKFWSSCFYVAISACV
jgi:hypothetical protein